MQELLHTFADLKKQKEELDAQLKAVKRQMAEINSQMTEQFVTMGMKNTTLEGVGRFTLYTTEIPNVANEVVCKDWLRDKGDMDLVMTFHTGKFRAYYKSLVEAEEELPPGIDVYVKQEVRLTKS